MALLDASKIAHALICFHTDVQIYRGSRRHTGATAEGCVSAKLTNSVSAAASERALKIWTLFYHDDCTQKFIEIEG